MGELHVFEGFFGSNVFGGVDGERWDWFVFDNRFDIAVVFVDVGEVVFGKNWCEFVGEVLGVLDADAEGDDRTDVAENSVFDIFFHLADKLVGDDQIEFELTGLG